MKKILIILIGFLLLNAAMTLLIDAFINIDDSYSTYYLFKILIKLILVALTMVLIIKYFKNVTLFKNSVYIIPAILIVSYLSYSHVNSQLGEISQLNNIVFLCSCLAVALFEELLFRVFIFQSLLKHYKKDKVLKSILITGLLFGGAHVTGFFKPEVIRITVLIQIVIAFGLGVFLQSLLLRFNNIVLVVGIHMIINYMGMYKSKLLLIEQEDTYSINDFIMSLSFSLVLVIILLAISYIIVKPILNRKISRINI